MPLDQQIDNPISLCTYSDLGHKRTCYIMNQIGIILKI